MIWKCPNCNLPLRKVEQSLSCDNNHSFDFAKQGHVNLLLSNQKNSKQPGDSPAMLEARNRFLSKGYYDPLVEGIAKFLPNTGTIIDLGCGEGYYLKRLLELKTSNTIEAYGIEIAKAGVKKAAIAMRGAQNVHLAVGNTYKIPVVDQSVERCLSIFAPYCPVEIARILNSDGQFIRVTPGPLHLQEIKAALYQQAKQHTQTPPPDGFRLLQSENLQFTSTMTGIDATQDLIPMTPLNWQGSVEAKQAITEQDQMTITFDFMIEIFSCK